MNRKLTFLAALVSLWIAGMVYGADFHVSPQGDDANPGTLDKPFKTLKRQRGMPCERSRRQIKAKRPPAE